MKETKVVERLYDQKELAEKLGIKGEITNAEISYSEDEVEGVKLTIKEETD